MTPTPNSPRLIKGGIVVIDPATSQVLRIIPFQYNPDTLTRTLQPQAAGAEGGDRLEALRLKGPPQETIKCDIEFDATEYLENPDKNSTVAEFGLFPALSALETLIYPTSDQLKENNTEMDSGALEITPAEAPLSLFVFSKSRVLPVRLTEMSVTEEAFDTQLNPLRAKVSLGMRVLNVNDVGFAHKGGNLYMIYHQQKETFATKNQSSALGTLGIRGIP
jgi:hypothetical protein